MRRLIFTGVVVLYAVVMSVVMIPLSILHGLFELYFCFIRQLYDGVIDYNREYKEAMIKASRPFSWEDYALEREKENAKTEESK